jgi:microcystin degradation protein MlrC
VVGDKPDKSPGDTSDLPPSGEELVETADEEASRAEKLGNRFFKRLEDVDDAVNDAAPSVQQVLDQRTPAGHPAVLADVHSHWAPESVSDAAPSVGGIAEVVLVLGVLADRAIHWGANKVAHKTGRGEG